MSNERATFFELQSKSKRRSLVLLAGSFVILLLAANIVTFFGHLDEECRPAEFGEPVCNTVFRFNPLLVVITAVVVVVYIGIAYLASAKAALRLAGARPAEGEEFAQLRNIVEEMSIASGTPMPSVYVVDDPSPNAFATGRTPEHAAVTVTTGLLQQLSRRELTGVVAHELAHIKNRDIAVTTLAVLTAGTIAVLADLAMRVAWYTAIFGRRSRGNSKGSAGIAVVAIAIAFALYLFALPAALLLRAALSRERESLADASAVQYTRDPSGIRSALEKLEADGTSPTRVSTATAHMWIDEPKPASSVQRGMLSGLFDTHPPMAERIVILRQMEGIDPEGRGPNDPAPMRAMPSNLPPPTQSGPGWGPPAGPYPDPSRG